MSNETNSVKIKVERLLKTHPQTRDDDRQLVVQFWTDELTRHGYRLEDMTGKHLLEHYSAGMLTSVELIQKHRRALQDHHSALRGDNWADRRLEEWKAFK